MLARLKFEISGLVKEILNQVDPSVFQSHDKTFLDPAMGGGQFIFEIIKRLKEQGHSNANIKPRVFGYESNILYVNYVKERYIREFGEEIPATLRVGGLEELESLKMYFDLVMGNPPYQSEKRTGTQPLWSLFVYKSLQLLKSDGYFAFIVPNKWLGHTTNVVKGKVHLYSAFFKGNLISVNSQECSKWFPGIGNTGEMFSYLIGTLKGSNQFQFQNKEGVYTVDKDDFEYLPLRLPSKITSSILRKVRTNESFQFKQSIYSENSNNYNIVINSAQRLSPNNTQIFLDDSKNTILRNKKPTVSNLSFRNSNQKIIDSVFRSKLFKFIFEIYWNGDTLYTTFFNSLPYVDLSRTWTDQELYAHFGLTEEEIRYIEEQVK